MGKTLKNFKKLILVLVVLTLAGLVIDYFRDQEAFPAEFTLFPLCLLITALLVMLVIWLFRVLVQPDR